MTKALLLAGVLALPAAAQETPHADLFTRLDRDGDGYLSESELRSERAGRSSWIATDRNRDGRITRDEFTAVSEAAPEEGGPGAYSARRLIGTPARDSSGAPVGTVRDILLDPQGRVVGLALDGGRRIGWHWTRVGPGGGYVSVPDASESAAAGATRPIAPRNEWRASELLGDAVQLEPGRRYGSVDDLIIAPAGDVSVIVVDAEQDGRRGRYAYPWPSRGAARVDRLRPFDYGELGILPHEPTPFSAGSR